MVSSWLLDVVGPSRIEVTQGLWVSNAGDFGRVRFSFEQIRFPRRDRFRRRFRRQAVPETRSEGHH